MKPIALVFLFAAASFAQQYTPQGDLALPKDYREWVFLSSGIGMTYSNMPNPNPVFDNVFVNPEAYQAFLKTGAWPDKTVLVKENRASDSHASNKEGRFQTTVVSREVHVKDASRGGWKFYVFRADSQPGAVVANQTVCDSCHSKDAVDYTFVEFYPTLIDAAKKNGTWHQ
jgi:hypothetical protein